MTTALSQGFLVCEADIAAWAAAGRARGVPGSESVVGSRVARLGAWESHMVPREAANDVKKRRRSPFTCWFFIGEPVVLRVPSDGACGYSIP